MRALRCGWVLLALAGACGDDDGGNSDAGAPDGGPAAGSTGAGTGGAPTAGTNGLPPIVPLGDDIAGKPCTSSAECEGAMCVTEVPGAAIAPIAAPGGYCTGECDTSADCGAGGACVGAVANLLRGQCFASCVEDTECRDEYFCTTATTVLGVSIPSTCRPKPATNQLEDGVAGQMCTTDADCAGGSCETMTAAFLGMGMPLPGGYCSGACLEDSHCGSGGVCAIPPIEGVAGGCFDECAADADCTRDGYRCRPQLGDVRGCDAFPDPLPDDVVGSECGADADCGGGAGTCRSALPVAGFGAVIGQTTPAPGGYCSERCTQGEADCGAGGACIGTALGGGTCFATCTGATDCRGGYICEERGGGGGQAMGDAGTDAGTTGTLVCVPVPTADADGGM